MKNTKITPEIAAEVLANMTVLVIGDNQCWGKATRLEDALVNACNPKGYIAYMAHKDTDIHPVDGSLSYPLGYAPVVIANKWKGKARVIGTGK